jgi:phosphoglycerate kinase
MISYDEFYRDLHQILLQDQELNSVTLEVILDSIPTIDQLRHMPYGSPVLIRADLDVPLEQSRVVDSSRTEANLPTITYCLERGWKAVLFGHIGRDTNLSLRPVSEAMRTAIAQPIEFISDWMDETAGRLRDEAVSKVLAAKPGTVIMLENTRKYEIETALWKASADDLSEICKKMYSIARDFRARLTSIEINEAIAASNFDFSSSVLPLAMVQTALGFYISEEMKTHVTSARRANLVVMSGLKIDKLNDLEAILERGKVKWIIAAGSLAMALRKAQAQLAGTDFCIGRAETDTKAKFYVAQDRIEQGKRIVRRCEVDGVDLVLPIDFVIDTGEIVQEIPLQAAQFDIGPKTRQVISNKIAEYISASKQSSKAFAMFYNGVFGKFEDPRYESGTRDFISHLKTITQAGILTYVGGGEGRLALLKYGSVADVTHAFTAGGTILKSLSDKHIHFLKTMYLQNLKLRLGTGENENERN